MDEVQKTIGSQDVSCTCDTLVPAPATFRGHGGSIVYGGETHIQRAHTKQTAWSDDTL
jgi:hypothetical protein